jgi:hypothetical protein
LIEDISSEPVGVGIGGAFFDEGVERLDGCVEVFFLSKFSGYPCAWYQA